MSAPSILKGSGMRARALVGLELFTGVAALAGGTLLMLKPDGSLLQAKMSALSESPFHDWFPPGTLLAALVGGGFAATGLWQAWRGALATELSLAAGLGLIAFEAVELAWIGFQPLEAAFSLVGVTVAALAWRERQRTRPANPQLPPG
ncbi:MAG TPA: hypothetical protein VJ010_08665 [Actinomycetota bacterium]|nr:hypothetical protein [Actinomycetota bacterium]